LSTVAGSDCLARSRGMWRRGTETRAMPRRLTMDFNQIRVGGISTAAGSRASREKLGAIEFWFGARDRARFGPRLFGRRLLREGLVCIPSMTFLLSTAWSRSASVKPQISGRATMVDRNIVTPDSRGQMRAMRKRTQKWAAVLLPSTIRRDPPGRAR
jgi:hypothetical protein